MSQQIIPVGKVSQYIRDLLAQDLTLRRISVGGEVSNVTYHRSGHIYFTIKDKTAQMSCVMWAGDRSGLSFSMKEGDQIVATGQIDVYLPQGRYQLYARKIERQGAGLLYEKFLAVKAELEEMGMFAEEYKQPIPFYVKRLGIVTAPTGAAIQDIRNIALRRNPYVELILYPSLVQGDGAVESIVRGIRTLDALGLDCLIVGRGGGSIEDLWAFNEEAVARAIFDCRTPVISAVGHETDTTIADLVADLRAPTPSAAAELAIHEIDDFFQILHGYRDRLNNDLLVRLRADRERLGAQSRHLQHLSPENQIREKRQRAIDLEETLQTLLLQGLQERKMKQAHLAARLHDRSGLVLQERKQQQERLQLLFRERSARVLQEKKHRLQLLLQRWEGASPIRKLQQGFAYVEDTTGHAVTEIGQVAVGDLLQIEVTDGVIRTQVTDTETRERPQVG